MYNTVQNPVSTITFCFCPQRFQVNSSPQLFKYPYLLGHNLSKVETPGLEAQNSVSQYEEGHIC